MRFMIDADLPKTAATIVRGYGYEAIDVRDIGLGTAKDEVIAHHAQLDGCCIVTGDYDFADLRAYPPENYAGIIVFYIPPTATSFYINALIDSFFSQKNLVNQAVGKLAIVEAGRVRFRSTR